MKKIACIFFSVVIFVTTSLSLIVPCSAASSAVVDFAIDTVLEYSKNIFNSYLDSSAKKAEAARSAYFTHLVDNVYSNGITIFDDSGEKFTDEILEYHFNQYWNCVECKQGFYDSSLDVFLSAAGFVDTRFDIRLLSFTDYKLSFGPLLGNFTNNIASNTKASVKQRFFDYYQSFLARYVLAQGGTATDPNPGKTGLQIAPGYISGSELKEAVEQDNNRFYPKNYAGKVSYRNDKYYQMWYENSKYNGLYITPYLYQDYKFTASNSDEIYLVFFQKIGDTMYYSEKQFHFWFTNTVTSSSTTSRILNCEVWSNVNEAEDKVTKTLDVTGASYLTFFLNSGVRTLFFNTFFDFINYQLTPGMYDSEILPPPSEFLYYASDLVTSIGFNPEHCAGTYSSHDSSCQYGGSCDIGYVASATPISTVYNVDTTKIPDDSVITVGGDNIYNYYITNPDTGESSTMNEYITNNYTYITNNNGGEGSGSSGGVGGNVNVSGEIAVGGEVGVDINVSVPDININVNNTGGSPNPEDFLGDSEVDLTSYYDKAVEDASGVRQFLGTFFDFLPAELLGLLCLLVAVAICCRIFGR